MAPPPMPSIPRPHTSLARSTLISMGVRIAAIIALATFFSYLHLVSTLRTEALTQLERHVHERLQREQGIFILAEDNHGLLNKALAEKLQSTPGQDVDARFDSLFVKFPDGTVRNRPETFDGTRQPAVVIPQGVALGDELRWRILASYDVLTQYGPAFHSRFTNTYITLPEGPLVLFWPESPNWYKEAESTFTPLTLEFMVLSFPANNPARETRWCAAYPDPVARSWMVSVSTPLDVGGRHIATMGHDVLLAELMDRTVNQHLPGAYNVLFRDDGQLIAHPDLQLEGATESYNLLQPKPPAGAGASALDSEERRAHLRVIFERVTRRDSKETVLELPESGEYLAAARLRGPGWNFVTVLPEAEVTRPALQAARYVLLFGVASLLLELAIMYWVLRQHITRPLLAFTEATDRVAKGDFHVRLDTARGDELGQLASAFRLMADKVQEREEALRQANEGLEQRVDARTRELKEVNRKLVDVARRAGMAEVATNVLHNVGNVLNSVNTTAMVVRERLEALRLEQVSRVAALLTEHQAELSTFVNQDERGRKLLPYLGELGRNLEQEREGLRVLLDDMDRYTSHIGTIVNQQQSYARSPRLIESVAVAELVEDALNINSATLSRHEVKVARRLEPVPLVVTDKHKVVMVLTNLISNAKDAMHAVEREQRCLTLKVGHASSARIRIEVCDQGTGIAPELLTRIFEHGFTTREDGHGFGLHFSALAAEELGGSLRAHSDGPGKGATFILELPLQPPAGS
ncbi:ATP-binding protein [Hyalangium rubrum]|uniref:histidine kinase n=1 Tax=Hyalangium rubrum TaxID=3103134 RepID=A0ABU5H9H8_9BACT|nr:ATP-binding protein [Hyalangium sp. s54d21]MDY7230134.1 ATP-binding protein [Hyalangium sp. s54d21]